ncbi:RNA methyltransferase [Aquibacillus halophilus]|uniref:RNA methyltransferase n=1 Tax=Aquibacillus halophilus TaxID=930132 RepID=A0A6A8DKG2_9BACI|nr:RNA methyltransferase [Aquibacillus halophilus]MRH41742.1 RNA methyltransferase [Aquibacillus halophilus]
MCSGKGLNRVDASSKEPLTYIYNYSWIEDEKSLCALEMRALFGADTESTILESTIKVDPSRSPFIKERIDVIYQGDTLQDVIRQVKDLHIDKSFRMIFVKNQDLEKVGFTERRKIERDVGLEIPGEADLVHPELLLGIMNVNGRWVFGEYYKNEAIWLHHQKKPHSYSTSLSTRVARAVANIAVPNPTGIKAIDPCCGIGTVLVEALSMGIDIVGSDFNPLLIEGVRENIAHFGLAGDVSMKDIRNVTGSYDVAIIDIPYNLYSAITPEQQREMLESARKFADKLVIVTIEPIDSVILGVGFEIIDRCTVKKGLAFVRQIIVCK